MNLLLDLLYLIGPGRLRRASGEALLALLVFGGLAVAVTWPVVGNLDQVIVGGGELGGWLWRSWWHFQEVEALGQSELGFLDRVATLVGLGRYPETGNILDILLLSYPLDRWFGFPASHNLKVLVILIGNGLCGYVLARSLSPSRAVALAAGAVAIVNPIVFQDINKTGLRQVLLWWLLLYPVVLARAQRTGSRIDGALVGVVFSLVAGFYWFYGLFAVMFSALHVGGWWIKERPLFRQAMEWMVPATIAAAVGVLFFVTPYLSSGAGQSGQGGIENLPELTFFLEFPAYDTIADAPLRPANYRDNVLSSLHRTIDSAWPADYAFNPEHGVLALPLAAFLFGVLPGLFVRRARTWAVVWGVFFLGTLGPFLKLGAQKDTSEVVLLGDHVIRLPYALMFQFIPGMSRMFAPYRMASMVVVATVALVALCLGGLPPWRRRLLGAVALVGVALQPFYRFDLGPVEEGSGGPAMWRVPTQTSAMQVPAWYRGLDPDTRQGIVELPLEQQQDILTAYQSVHRQKVYRSWATAPAIPPPFRESGGGAPAQRLRWLASEEPAGDRAEGLLRDLSREPLDTDLSLLPDEALRALMGEADYRWIVVHERGFYLHEPTQGDVMYRHVVRALAERLGQEPVELTEHEAFDWPGKERQFPAGPAWIPWSSREVHLPSERMPSRYFMAVFDLQTWAGEHPPAGTPSPAPDTPSPAPDTPSPAPDTPSSAPDTPSPAPDTPPPPGAAAPPVSGPAAGSDPAASGSGAAPPPG